MHGAFGLDLEFLNDVLCSLAPTAKQAEQVFLCEVCVCNYREAMCWLPKPQVHSQPDITWTNIYINKYIQIIAIKSGQARNIHQQMYETDHLGALSEV